VSITCPTLIAAHYPQLCAAVDNYCERTSGSLDAEPINALTNVAFLIAAGFAWRLHRLHRRGVAAGLVNAVIVTIVIVGLGSFLFHTVATRWAEWGDVLPILVFMLLYIWLALTVFFAWPSWLKLLNVLIFFCVTFYLEASVPARFLWGGALYLPTLVVMIAISSALLRQGSVAVKPLLAATAVFLLSFSARTLDMQICSVFPLGTHFLWHLLNATLLYLLVRAAIIADPAMARTDRMASKDLH
jgi:Ceramidase